MPTATITQSFTITTQAGTVTTFARPIPMFGNEFTEILDGDEIRHYWARACNGLGCGELSEAIVLGGGLLGIGESDNARTAISVSVNIDGVVVTAAPITDMLTDILQTPTNVGVKLCQSGDLGRTVPHAVVNWDIRDTIGDDTKGDGRFYRVSRSRYADSTSAELVICRRAVFRALARLRILTIAFGAICHRWRFITACRNARAWRLRGRKILAKKIKYAARLRLRLRLLSRRSRIAKAARRLRFRVRM